MAAAAIAAFLLVVMIEVGRAAWQRFMHGGGPEVTWPASFAVMLATIAVNIIVGDVRAAGGRTPVERGAAGGRHAHAQRRADIVDRHHRAGRIGAGLPAPGSDGRAVVVVGFIGHAAWEIVKATSDILGDRVAIPEDEVRDGGDARCRAVMGCHAIRTRGSADFVFLDLHIWMAPETPLDEAHAISHEVKDRLMARFPEIGDAIIHIEPPPRTDADRNRKTEAARVVHP